VTAGGAASEGGAASLFIELGVCVCLGVFETDEAVRGEAWLECSGCC